MRRRESGEKSVGEISKSTGELIMCRENLKIGGDRWGGGAHSSGGSVECAGVNLRVDVHKDAEAGDSQDLCVYHLRLPSISARSAGE